MTRLSIYPCILLALIGLAGCGGKKTPDSTVTLSFTFFGDIRNKPFGDALIAAFEKSHPQVKIKPTYIIGDYTQKLLVMIAGGNSPDVMVITNGMVPDFASRGILLDLQPFMDSDKEFSAIKNDIYPGGLATSTYRERYYAIPIWTNSLVVYYNKDIFDQAGLPYPDGTWDWKKLVEVGRKLTRDTDKDGAPKQYGFFFQPRLSDTAGGLPFYISQNGGQLISKDFNKCLIDQPAAVDAVRWCFDLVTKYKITPSPVAGDERLRNREESFLSGRVAMTVSGRWSASRFSTARFRWACAPRPRGKVDFKSSGSMWLAAYTKTKHPRECWEFLKFMLGEEAQKIVRDLKADIPIRISVANTPEFLSYLSRPDVNKVFLEEMAGSEEFIHFPGEKEWMDSADSKFDLVLMGKRDLESVCGEIAGQYRIPLIARNLQLRLGLHKPQVFHAASMARVLEPGGLPETDSGVVVDIDIRAKRLVPSPLPAMVLHMLDHLPSEPAPTVQGANVEFGDLVVNIGVPQEAKADRLMIVED